VVAIMAMTAISNAQNRWAKRESSTGDNLLRLYLRLRCILSLFRDDCASDNVGRRRTDLSLNGLIAGIIAGAFGMAYFVYGKRQSKVVPVVAGVLLCVYPYFTENPYALIAIGAALLAAPFFLDF
jgi:hypothetical protein